MTSPTISQEALPLAMGATYLGFLSQLPPDAVLGSFTGAVIFLLGVSNKPKWQWVLLFTVAFMAGILGGPTVSHIIEAVLKLVGLEVKVPLGMSSMASAACTVNFISWVRDNPSVFLRRGKATDKGEAE